MKCFRIFPETIPRISFIYWKNEMGEDELITPPADNLILHGIVRDSVLVKTLTFSESIKIEIRTWLLKWKDSRSLKKKFA